MKKLLHLFTTLLFLLILVVSCNSNNIHFLQIEGADFVQNMSTGRTMDADSLN